MGKVSIIVPVYKVEGYLEKCLDSILGQTYTDLQVIVVDDGSPDRCGEICDAYAQKDSRVLSLHKHNGGVSSARNYGLKYVQGEYVTFCDSDDCYRPDWIEQLVNTMEETEADIAVGGFTFVYEDGTPPSGNSRVQGVWDLPSDQDVFKYCFEMVMTEKHGWEIWDRMFRSELIRKHDIRFCETCGNYAEDLGFVLACTLFAGRIASVDSCGYLYSVRGGSMMQRSIGVPKLNSLHEVYGTFEPVCREAFAPEVAERVLPWFYLQLIASQFIPKLWASGLEPEELREVAISGVPDWDDMARRLRHSMDRRQGRNPYLSGCDNMEIRSNIRFLLGGSWTRLRIECKLIKLFRSLLNGATR